MGLEQMVWLREARIAFRVDLSVLAYNTQANPGTLSHLLLPLKELINRMPAGTKVRIGAEDQLMNRISKRSIPNCKGYWNSSHAVMAIAQRHLDWLSREQGSLSGIEHASTDESAVRILRSEAIPLKCSTPAHTKVVNITPSGSRVLSMVCLLCSVTVATVLSVLIATSCSEAYMATTARLDILIP